MTLRRALRSTLTLTTKRGYAWPLAPVSESPGTDGPDGCTQPLLRLLLSMFKVLLRRPATISARSRLMSSVKLTNRPHDWKAAAPESPAITFGSQRNLPKLPVPELNQTLARLKETLKPIAWSDHEYSTVEKKIDDFALNKGPELHERLLMRYGQTPHWLEQWWDDVAYLGYRDSVIHIPVLILTPVTE